MNGHSSPTTRRFVRTAWLLLGFQLFAAIGAGAAAIWAASSVRHLADERDMLKARVTELEARPAALAPAPPPEAEPQLVPDTIEIPAGPAPQIVPTPAPAPLRGPAPVRPTRPVPTPAPPPVYHPPQYVPPPIVPPVVQPEETKPPVVEDPAPPRPRPRPRRPRITIDIPSLFGIRPDHDTPAGNPGNPQGNPGRPPGRPSTNNNNNSTTPRPVYAAPQAAQPVRTTTDPPRRRRVRTDEPQQTPPR